MSAPDTSPASAPLETMAVISNLMKLAVNVRYWVAHGCSETAVQALDDAMANGWDAMGWNAAVAAQRTEEAQVDWERSEGFMTGEPCCDNGNFGDGHECQKQPQPPEPAPQIAAALAAQPPAPSHQVGDANKCMGQVSPLPHTAPSSSTRIEGDGTPPQPGDAAQPPEPVRQKKPVGGEYECDCGTRDIDETCHAGSECRAEKIGTPPQPSDAQPPEPVPMTSCNCPAAPGEDCPLTPAQCIARANRTPPQPSDVERLFDASDTRYLGKVREKLQETQAWNRDISDIAFVLRLLDASQSALAESRAEMARLQAERDRWVSRASVAQAARLRSPPATGEEYLSCGHHKGNIGDTGACEACNDIAAARAQGEQEERERWLDCAQVDATMEGPKLKGWNRSALDRLWRRALTTPEPQEEKL